MKRRKQSLSLKRFARVGWIPLCLFLGACHLDMYNQPKAKPYESSTFFEDEVASRPLVSGVVAQGQDPANTVVNQGMVDGEVVAEIPIEVTGELLVRGQEQYEVFCGPCHGAQGQPNENSLIVIRLTEAVLPPPSMYLQRLRDVTDGHFFDVITNGVEQDGNLNMFPYASRIAPEDRWAIVAYIRQLQDNPPEEVDPNPTAVSGTSEG
ncbi:MAG: cytochrome c [Chloroflexi bacterium AL-W]|nr:cytochrome c [Chloroflexi bacterium AL-N1]NOK70371.1 cytochrome c [Chloroflexi bacterium AL-N10]NOK78049.1 cytochrome c [Chloroflexi bacterium AL-N5]NOK85148.1 cytochrome c [Chloroflexi bacterium AL-W]NOK92137.1 cytochrome c [Chloroflexi bacterium AL-N15]